MPQREAADFYRTFSESATQEQWKKIGLFRRSGVVVPLFSIHSQQSIGIGEIPDLKLLMDWCLAVGMSLIQLLPLNDTGFNFTPYDAQSSFALDPMYLSLAVLKSTEIEPFQKKIQALRKKYPAGKPRVNYALKGAKLELLWEIYQHESTKFPQALQRFYDENQHWIDDYALFQILKSKHEQSSWETWSEPFRRRDTAELEKLKTESRDIFNFRFGCSGSFTNNFSMCAATRKKRKSL